MTVRIDPDGTVTPVEGTPLDAANAVLDYTSVVTCGAPFLTGHDTLFVGVIDDFGAQDQPINWKAWALYGRSPIYGPMWFGADVTGDVPSLLVEKLSQPLDEMVSARTIELMNNIAAQGRPPMVARRRPGDGS